MVFVVQLRDRLSQGSDTGSWAVLSAMSTNVHLLRPLKASLYAVVHFGRTLTQVGPFLRLVEKAMLVGLPM
jgi:hypothetical protein